MRLLSRSIKVVGNQNGLINELYKNKKITSRCKMMTQHGSRFKTHNRDAGSKHYRAELRFTFPR